MRKLSIIIAAIALAALACRDSGSSGPGDSLPGGNDLQNDLKAVAEYQQGIEEGRADGIARGYEVGYNEGYRDGVRGNVFGSGDLIGICGSERAAWPKTYEGGYALGFYLGCTEAYEEAYRDGRIEGGFDREEIEGY